MSNQEYTQEKANSLNLVVKQYRELIFSENTPETLQAYQKASNEWREYQDNLNIYQKRDLIKLTNEEYPYKKAKLGRYAIGAGQYQVTLQQLNELRFPIDGAPICDVGKALRLLHTISREYYDGRGIVDDQPAILTTYDIIINKYLAKLRSEKSDLKIIKLLDQLIDSVVEEILKDRQIDPCTQRGLTRLK